MLNISTCYNNIDETNILNNFLNTFSLDNNFKYKLHNYNSIEDLMSLPLNKSDILFLDIDLNDKDYVCDLYQKINKSNQQTQIIFTPKLIDFMLNGFFLKDFRYILKPLDYDVFADELSSCINFFNNKNHISPSLDVPTDTIYFIESRDNYCIYHTSKGSIKTEFKINQINKKLCPSSFYRCHDNFIINLKKVCKLNRHSIIINSVEIPISESKFTQLKKSLLVLLNII